MFARLRATLATVAPYARPLIAVTVISWGITTLTTLVDERRAELGELDEARTRLSGEVRGLLADVHAAAAQLQDYRSRLAALQLQERADEGESSIEVPAHAPAATLPVHPVAARLFDIAAGAVPVPVDEQGAPVDPATGVAFG